MYHAFFSKAQELLDQNTPFAMAVVVRAEKPTSGKPGDKALIAVDGTMYGWIGGSCSQPTVIREALKALKEGRSRFIRLSPDPEKLTPRDGLIDFPLTCFSGGTLEIYIEPQYPQPRLMVIGSLPVARALVSLGKVMNYDVIAVDPDGSSIRDAHHVLTNLDDIPHYVRPDTYAVVATHGSYDETALEHLLKARPRYIGLVASKKRFQSVLEYLRMQGVDETDLQQIKAPAGLDIQAQQGDEIALSILAEIVQYRRSAQEADDWNAPADETVSESLAFRPSPQLAGMPVLRGGGGEEDTLSGNLVDNGPGESAPTPTKAPQATLGIAFDPVCLMEVDIATARWTYEYEGTTYYFCAPGCKLQFRRNPQAFLQADSGTAVDSVCAMEVDIETAQHRSVFRGRTFYFCGEGCKATFDQNPEAYVSVMHH